MEVGDTAQLRGRGLGRFIESRLQIGGRRLEPGNLVHRELGLGGGLFLRHLHGGSIESLRPLQASGQTVPFPHQGGAVLLHRRESGGQGGRFLRGRIGQSLRVDGLLLQPGHRVRVACLQAVDRAGRLLGLRLRDSPDLLHFLSFGRLGRRRALFREFQGLPRSLFDLSHARAVIESRSERRTAFSLCSRAARSATAAISFFCAAASALSLRDERFDLPGFPGRGFGGRVESGPPLDDGGVESRGFIRALLLQRLRGGDTLFGPPESPLDGLPPLGPDGPGLRRVPGPPLRVVS